MIYGERVRQARELRNLTQEALAKKIEVSQGMLSHVESGRTQPTDEVLRAIAFHTGLLPGFFREEPDHSFPIGSLAFRAHASLTSNQRAQAHRYGEIMIRMVRRLALGKRFVPVQLPRLGEDAVQAAEILRSQMGLAPDAPIPNLMRALELLGVVVVVMPLSFEKLQAYSAWTGEKTKRPVIVLSDMADGARQRLTAAHETGHLVLDGEMHGTGREVEDRAYQFGAELLMPANAMRQVMTSPITLSSLSALKPVWKVSIQALIVRANDLELITPRQYRYLYEQLSGRGWRRQEPIEIPVERPRMLRQLAEMTYGKPVDVQTMASDLKMSVRLVRQVLDAHEPGTASSKVDASIPRKSGVLNLTGRGEGDESAS